VFYTWFTPFGDGNDDGKESNMCIIKVRNITIKFLKDIKGVEIYIYITRKIKVKYCVAFREG
jgi:hypothetical protein